MREALSPLRLKLEPESELIVVALHAEREHRAGRSPVGRRAHCLHLAARRPPGSA